MKYRIIEHSNGNVSLVGEGIEIKNGKNDTPKTLKEIRSDLIMEPMSFKTIRGKGKIDVPGRGLYDL